MPIVKESSQVKLQLTKKEYRALLDMLHVADWVLHSHAIQPEDVSAPHKAVMKKILSYSSEMDVSDLISYDQADDAYYETREYEEFLQNMFIEPYDQETFWEELADHLAQRDALREFGEEKLRTMDRWERGHRLGEKSNAYEKEFAEYGLERFTLTKAPLKR